MREIPLSRGLVAYVDDADYEWLSLVNWHAHVDGYAVRNVTSPDGKRTLQLMHRVILGIPNGDKTCVDHINLNRSDNQRSNLRSCNRSDNGANRRALRSNSSGYKGVSWHKHSGKYVAKIRKNGVVKTLGYFTDPAQASERYNTAADEIHGSFARSN